MVASRPQGRGPVRGENSLWPKMAFRIELKIAASENNLCSCNCRWLAFCSNATPCSEVSAKLALTLDLCLQLQQFLRYLPARLRVEVHCSFI